jgi:type VI secretion system lysozyme-like protein
MSFLSKLARLPPEDELDAIVRNLGYVLNAKKGVASFLPSFGLGDYEPLAGTKAPLEVLRQEIDAAVRRYEPRLEEPSVTVVGRDPRLWMRFLLAGTVLGEPRKLYVDFHSTYHEVVVKKA